MAFLIDDRSEVTFRKLWGQASQEYRGCHSYSDFRGAYQLIFSEEIYERVGNGNGQRGSRLKVLLFSHAIGRSHPNDVVTLNSESNPHAQSFMEKWERARRMNALVKWMVYREFCL
jgi:hypothetical protein